MTYYLHAAAKTGCEMKDHKMKLIASLFSLSILVAATAFAGEKGAENLAARNGAAAEPGAVSGHEMKCKTELRTAVDSSARGAFKSASVYTAHACPTCETKEVSKGVGKQATRTLAHACSSASVCCGAK